MEHTVLMEKVVLVEAESLADAARKAEAENSEMVATRVYCDSSGEGDFITDHCEGCSKPMLSGDKSGAEWEDGVRTCGGCTGLEPGDQIAGRPNLAVVS